VFAVETIESLLFIVVHGCTPSVMGNEGHLHTAWSAPFNVSSLDSEQVKAAASLPALVPPPARHG
jgi:hypothetical protein